MAIRAEHEIHNRRKSRNVGVGVLLLSFVGLMFALSVVKVTSLGGPVEGYDHVVRPALVEQSQ